MKLCVPPPPQRHFNELVGRAAPPPVSPLKDAYSAYALLTSASAEGGATPERAGAGRSPPLAAALRRCGLLRDGREPALVLGRLLRALHLPPTAAAGTGTGEGAPPPSPGSVAGPSSSPWGAPLTEGQFAALYAAVAGEEGALRRVRAEEAEGLDAAGERARWEAAKVRAKGRKCGSGSACITESCKRVSSKG